MEKVIWSWKSEVPRIVKNIRDGFISAVAASLPFAVEISKWLNVTLAEFAAGAGISIAIAKFMAKCFGVSDDDQKNNQN